MNIQVGDIVNAVVMLNPVIDQFEPVPNMIETRCEILGIYGKEIEIKQIDRFKDNTGNITYKENEGNIITKIGLNNIKTNKKTLSF